jgi:DNA-binding IclR family transcriptional regulator
MVVRVTRVLEAFRESDRPLGLADVIGACGIPKATAFRVLETLLETGYLIKDDQSRYALSYKLLEVAVAVQERDPARKIALPYLEAIREEFGETVNMGVFQKDHVLYIEGLESRHTLRMTTGVGERRPIYAAALGKAIAAWLPREDLDAVLRVQTLRRFTKNTITGEAALRSELRQVARRGYAVDDEENLLGCICVAAPIFDAGGRVRWAISISAPSSRMSPERVARVGKYLARTCRSISRRLRFHR